jgi:hypothetical protein
VVALPADAAYLENLAGLGDDVALLQADLAATKPGKVPGGLAALLERHDALAKRLQDAKVAPAEGIAIELGDFAESRMRVTWDKVVHQCTSLYCPPAIPTSKHLDLPTLNPWSFVANAKRALGCLATAEEQIAKLAGFDPPPHGATRRLARTMSTR